MSAGVRRVGAWLVLAGMCAAGSPAASEATGGGRSAGPWVGDIILSPGERREVLERRAALEARASELGERLGACRDLRAIVREGLAEVRQVQAVEVGLVLLTSSPPKMPATFAIELSSGRVVRDQITVTVPVTPGLVLLGGAAGNHVAPPCVPSRH